MSEQAPLQRNLNSCVNAPFLIISCRAILKIPKTFHVRIGPDSKTMPIAQVAILRVLDSKIALFEDALKVIEGRFPSQSHIDIPQEPLVCTTPLIQNEQGVIEPTENASLLIPPHTIKH